MKNVFRKSVALIVAVMLLGPMLLSVPVNAAKFMTKEETMIYDIDEPYTYPIVPGTLEWNSLETHIDMIDACQIPYDVLSHMTTAALLETVLGYPLLIDMYLWDSIDIGYDSLVRNFNGLRELMERNDLDDVMASASVSARFLSVDEIERSGRSVVESDTLAILNVKCSGSLQAESVYAKTASRSVVTVYTPAGSAVNAIANNTYYLVFGEDYTDEEFAARVAAYEAEIAAKYPDAIKISDATVRYNCHSYAWYGQGEPTNYWIENPTNYMTDGSYVQVDINNLSGMTMMVYVNSSYTNYLRYIHSAVIFTSMVCYSKFGPYGEYQHNLMRCPYWDRSTFLEFWRLNPDYSDVWG